MKIILNLFLIWLIVACDHYSSKSPSITDMTDQQYKELINAHLDTLKSRENSIFIGFKLGSNSKEVENHIKELRNKGKIGAMKTVDFSIDGNNLSVEGYPYDFFIGDKKNESLINLYFNENKKLEKLDINIYQDVDHNTATELLRLYQQKYGIYARVNVQIGNTKHFWIKNNIEVILDHFWIQKIIMISYRDLTTDKIKFQLDKKQKKENQGKSKETINDI